MNSFANGQVITVATKLQSGSHSAVPHNPKLDFNKVVSPPQGRKGTDVNYSIDIGRFLRSINSFDPSDLNKITLAGKSVQQNVGLWDVFFNSSQFRPSSAAVLVVQNNYEPIPQDRVVVSSSYLDYSHQSTRSHLNRMETGDRVGIVIRDAIGGFTHVLLYTVEDSVLVRTTPTQGSDHSVLVPGVNLSLEHRFHFDHAVPNRANQFQVGETEYDPEVEGPFVAWLVDTAYDIPGAYPWKPHFIAYQPEAYNREELETRLAQQVTEAQEVDYDDFEQMCRSAYQTAKAKRPPRDNTPQPQPPKGQRMRPRARPAPPVLPVVEIVSVGDTFYANVPGENETVKFTKESMGSQVITERNLTNRDLENVMIKESTLLLTLPASFGDGAMLRYFTINF